MQLPVNHRGSGGSSSSARGSSTLWPRLSLAGMVRSAPPLATRSSLHSKKHEPALSIMQHHPDASLLNTSSTEPRPWVPRPLLALLSAAT